MAHLEAPYYAGLLSAASYYGAASEPPEPFQVVTEKNRPPIACGRVGVQFIARQSVGDVPTREFKTNRGRIAVSTPEATAIDLAAYPHHAGGLETIALVLVGLAPQMEGEALARLAGSIAETPWVQRLGYLLDHVGASEVAEPLARFVAANASHATPLDPRLPWTGTPRDQRWRVAVNRER
jgi:predicted transcriptional regulator of viral defense system